MLIPELTTASCDICCKLLLLADYSMERDYSSYRSELTGIHINLETQAIEFEDRHGTVGRLRFTGETVLYEGRPLLLTPTDDPLTAADPPAPPVPDQPPSLADPSPRPSHNPSSREPRG